MNESSASEEFIRTLVDGEVTIARAAELFGVSTIIERFGQWAVTDYGLECLVTSYAIGKMQLSEDDWVSHMSEKQWLNVQEFEEALQAARDYHKVRPVEAILSTLPPPPPISARVNPSIDAYTTRRLKTALWNLHQIYNAIGEHVPDDLPKPKHYPGSFSIKEDILLSGCWAAFVDVLDGFLTAIGREDVIGGGPFYQSLLGYTYDEFRLWLDKLIEDSLST